MTCLDVSQNIGEQKKMITENLDEDENKNKLSLNKETKFLQTSQIKLSQHLIEQFLLPLQQQHQQQRNKCITTHIRNN